MFAIHNILIFEPNQVYLYLYKHIHKLEGMS